MSVSLLFLYTKNEIAGETITEFEKPPYVDIKQLYRISTDKELGSGIPFYHYWWLFRCVQYCQESQRS